MADVDETEDTLEGNARLKAITLVEATGKPAVADDTGLEVDALNGRPGVYSARYAGENVTYTDNVNKMVLEMQHIETDNRTGAVSNCGPSKVPDGRELISEGIVDGLIAETPSPGGGFGYDPLFIPHEGDGRTFAQMDLEEKNAISHRGRAFRVLRSLIGS